MRPSSRSSSNAGTAELERTPRAVTGLANDPTATGTERSAIGAAETPFPPAANELTVHAPSAGEAAARTPGTGYRCLGNRVSARAYGME